MSSSGYVSHKNFLKDDRHLFVKRGIIKNPWSILKIKKSSCSYQISLVKVTFI